ncbi:MAG: hypothetical protein ACXVFA_10030 [Solirubrobacteraceae bacterium]
MRVVLVMGARGRARAVQAAIGVVLCALGVAAMLAQTAMSAGHRSAHSLSRDAVVSGYVRLCGGPAPGGCRIETFGICQPPRGCVTSHRVAAINARGRRVAVQRLHHARFRMVLAPGRYTIELLGDGKQVHGRVMQRKTVTARADRTVVVRFVFAVP